tara:strand:+ start:2286 stop:2705 length:420 start_codon:yes stop_codon:yes gene_type:complete
VKAGWENWQGGFIRVGYPPPCQPPLVAAGSSSPSSTPKSSFQIVDILFPRCLLPSCRACSPSTEVVGSQGGFDFTIPEGFVSSQPVLNFRIFTEVILFLSNGGQSVVFKIPEGFFHTRSLTMEVRLNTSEEVKRGFRPW